MPMSGEAERARGALAAGGKMHGAVETRVDEERVLRLVPGWEEKGGALSPEEGFLLSRIDGYTSWEMLRRIGGIEPERVDRCLERWLAEGLVVIDGCSSMRQIEKRPQPPPRPVISDGKAQPGGIDESLEIPVELQQRILDFEGELERPYHEILGVDRDADERAIKRAYFKLSKDFHPDRYFGREIGAFAARLDRIFKKVALACELLMDPTTRAEIERALRSAPPEPATQGPAGVAAPPSKLGKREMLERLRRQVRIPEKILTERRFKARQFCDAARVAQHKGNWKGAASCIRLAIAFDPWTDEYKEAFAEVLAEVNRLRAAELFEEARGAWDEHSGREALRLFEEAIHYRPSDPRTHDRAAQVALEIEKLDRAREYADRACELAPEVAAYHLTRGRVLCGQGLHEKAREALETASKLDPDDSTARKELKRLRKRPGHRSGGKR
jgi:curved DNA-binding protein CbpA